MTQRRRGRRLDTRRHVNHRASSPRALDEIHDRFRGLDVNDPRRSTGQHFAIPRLSRRGHNNDRRAERRRWGRRCPLGRCRSRVRSHAEGGGGNLYSGIPMASGFRHQGKLALVAGHRSFAVYDDTGRQDTRTPLSGDGIESDRICPPVLSGLDRVSGRTQPGRPR